MFAASGTSSGGYEREQNSGNKPTVIAALGGVAVQLATKDVNLQAYYQV